MCITNQMTDEILKDMREIEREGVDKTESEKLASFLALVKILEDDIKIAKDFAKTELLKRGEKDTFYFPNINKKVYLTEGNASTIYYIREIYNDLFHKGLENSFFNIINVIQKKVDDLKNDEVTKVVEQHSQQGPKGEDIIKVLGMNKKELIEHAKK